MTFFHLSYSVFSLGLFGAGAARRDADFGERGLELRFCSVFCSSPLSLAAHVGGQAGRRKDAEPEIDLKALEAAFVHRRQVRIDLLPLGAGGGERARGCPW